MSPFERAFASMALAVATGCARPAAPVASPVAPTIINVTPGATAAAAAPVVAAPVAPASAAPSHAGGAVRPGNQHALNAAAVPFAKYINAMHNRIHGPFTDESLARLDTLPPNDPLNDKRLTMRLELVIEGTTGKLLKQGVVRSSGLTAFDVLALDAVNRAAPFGPADAQLWSSDGNVYVHWEFNRDPVFGCSTMHVRPYLIDVGAAPPAQGTP